MQTADALIIGAGPAGTSCAMALATRGRRVVLVDRSVFPRAKTCGGFIAPESRKLLESMGVWNELLSQGAQLVNKAVLSSADGTAVTIPVHDGPALGVSRDLLDKVLLARAKALGVEVLEGARIRQVIGDDKGFELDIDHYSRGTTRLLKVRDLISATGHPVTLPDAPGVQMGIGALYEDIPALRGQVSLVCCRGGHVGINPFELGKVNVCYVVEAGLFKACGNDPQRVIDAWTRENISLQNILGKARRVTPWKAVCVPARKAVVLNKDGIWRVGDAAAFIDPVTGGGMSVALLSGQFLAGALLAHDDEASRLRQYARDYHTCFVWQRRVAALWGGLAHHPLSARMVIGFLNDHAHFKSMGMRYSHPPSSLRMVGTKQEVYS